MNKERPINLDLTKFRFPPMAIVSIMHRLSGVALFLLIPFMLYLLQATLASPASYAALLARLNQPLVGGLAWVLAAAAGFHFLAGIRHLLMDCGLGETVRSGRITAYLVFALWLLCVIGVGVRLW